MKEIHNKIIYSIIDVIENNGEKIFEFEVIYENSHLKVRCYPEVKRGNYYAPKSVVISESLVEPMLRVSESGKLIIYGKNIDIDNYIRKFPNHRIETNIFFRNSSRDSLKTQIIIQKDFPELENCGSLEDSFRGANINITDFRKI